MTRTYGTWAQMAIAAAAIVIATAPRAAASTILITSQSGLRDQAKIGWNALGADFTDVSNPFTLAAPGVPALHLTGSQTAGVDFLRVDQGNTWIGNFAPGDALLYTLGGGPIDLRFDIGIMGFGAQIQAASLGAFTARIQAFDASNTLLGSFTLAGLSTQAANDSAPFLGILSTAHDIRRVQLSLTSAVSGVGDFAIGDPTIQIMPEPASLLLLLTGLVGVGLRASRRR